MAQDQNMTPPNPEQPQVVYVQAPKKPWFKKPGCMIPLGIVALLIIAGAAGLGGSSDDSSSSTSNVASSDSGASASDASADQGSSDAKADSDSKDAKAEEAAPAAAIELTSVDYVSAYETNEIAGDAAYKGKELRVSGVVKSVSETFGSYVLQLEGPGVQSFDSVSIADTWCRLEKDQIEKAATLQPGMNATVQGIGDGFDGLSAKIKKCTIV